MDRSRPIAIADPRSAPRTRRGPRRGVSGVLSYLAGLKNDRVCTRAHSSRRAAAAGTCNQHTHSSQLTRSSARIQNQNIMLIKTRNESAFQLTAALLCSASQRSIKDSTTALVKATVSGCPSQLTAYQIPTTSWINTYVRTCNLVLVPPTAVHLSAAAAAAAGRRRDGRHENKETADYLWQSTMKLACPSISNPHPSRP
jgi:hypothetical protein